MKPDTILESKRDENARIALENNAPLILMGFGAIPIALYVLLVVNNVITKNDIILIGVSILSASIFLYGIIIAMRRD